jgi:hypothetical protein
MAQQAPAIFDFLHIGPLHYASQLARSILTDRRSSISYAQVARDVELWVDNSLVPRITQIDNGGVMSGDTTDEKTEASDKGFERCERHLEARTIRVRSLYIYAPLADSMGRFTVLLSKRSLGIRPCADQAMTEVNKPVRRE